MGCDVSKTFVWTRKRVFLAEILMNSPHPLIPAEAARKVGFSYADIVALLERMETEGIITADRPLDPDEPGTERTFTIASGARTLVAERIARFRRRYPLTEWLVEIDCPIPELSDDEVDQCLMAMPHLIHLTQKAGRWTTFTMKVNAETRDEAKDVAIDEHLDTWEHVLGKPVYPCGISRAIAYQQWVEHTDPDGSIRAWIEQRPATA